MDDTSPDTGPRAAPSTDLPPMDRLRAIMARLRDPETGCPWDIEQDFATIAPYTIEEAYEVADAIERQDWDELRASWATFSCRRSTTPRWPRRRGISPSTRW
jgi:hypothetical protein